MKRILLTSLVLLVLGVQTAFCNEDAPQIVKAEIVNDNLFIKVGFIDGFQARHITLKLHGGKKIKVPVIQNNIGETVIYLNAGHAYRLKDKGIKAVIGKGPGA